MADPAVHIDEVRKTYRSGWRSEGVDALQGVSLRVPPGEVFGLLGPNGAGKTTLVKILLGLVRPSGGDASLFGIHISNPAARRHVGYLPEQHRFPPHFTATNILNLYGRLSGVPPEARKNRIPDLLDRVALGQHADAKLKTFSKGMRQRLGLAQALLQDPELLFLDEPTDGVDPVGRKAIRDLLIELRDEGKTIFLNSHLLSEIEQLCSRVAILKEGHLLQEGRVADLTSIDKTYDLICTPLSDDLLIRLKDANHITQASTENDLVTYRVVVPGRDELNDMIDAIRSEGAKIESLTPIRRTLEEHFIQALDTPEDEPTHA